MEKFGGGSRSIIEAEGGEIGGERERKRKKLGFAEQKEMARKVR